MARRVPCIIEPMESRMLFSAAIGPIIARASTQPLAAVKLAVTGAGTTLNLQAGVPFTGQVAFIPSSASGLGPSAKIDWGDGTVTSATLQTTMQAGITGYDVIGSHTYADPGTYAIVTRMVLTPISPPGQPTPQFIVVEPPVISTAIVAPAATTAGSGAPNPSTAGVTIHEVAGEKFSADLGSFTTLAPGTHLRITIKWGDGKTSVGRVVPSGGVGLDELTFDITGTHKYTRSGTFGITITVLKLPVGPSLALAKIASLSATADVAAKPPK